MNRRPLPAFTSLRSRLYEQVPLTSTSHGLGQHTAYKHQAPPRRGTICAGFSPTLAADPARHPALQDEVRRNIDAAARGGCEQVIVFAGNRPLVRETHVAGQCVVAGGRHRDHDAIAARYRDTLEGLLAD